MGQKNDMSGLPFQDSGIPRRVDYQGGDSGDGDCGTAITVAGLEVGQ